MPTNVFPQITLLITHYNRSSSLERLLSTVKMLGLSFGDIVVSDDGSKPEHQEKLQFLGFCGDTFHTARLVGFGVAVELQENMSVQTQVHMSTQ